MKKFIGATKRKNIFLVFPNAFFMKPANNFFLFLIIMPSCAVPTCNNSSSRKVKADDVKCWHMIPSDKKTSSKMDCSQQMRTTYPKKDRDFQFCGIHFVDECFERNIMAELMVSKSYNLKEDAVTTIFPFSKSKRKRISSEIRAARRVKEEFISQMEVENLPCSRKKADEMGNDDAEDPEEIEGLEEKIEFEGESQPDTEVDAAYEIGSENDEDGMEEHLEIFTPFEFDMVLVSWDKLKPLFIYCFQCGANAHVRWNIINPFMSKWKF